MSANKLKIELDKGKGLFAGRMLSVFLKSPTKFIAAILLGNNIALVVYGIFMEHLLAPKILHFLPGIASYKYFMLLIQTLIATTIILIFAEFLPKALFRVNSNALLNFFVIPVMIVYYLLYPVVFFFINLTEWVMKIFFRIRISEGQQVFSIVDLDDYIKDFRPDEHEDDEVRQELQMVQNALEFRHIKLRECMVPRTEIIAVEDTDSIDELRNKFIEFGFSRILVYKDSIDNIIGYVHSFDMFRKPENTKDVLKSIMIVPETMPAKEVLTMFTQQHKSLAIVVDEFGGTSGMVTMEDTIEEIFGEIEDEFDDEELTEQMISGNEYIFSARLEIDYLNDKYNLNLPESDEYETLSGLIIHFHESIPEANERIMIRNFVFDIVHASETKIEQVKLKIND